MPNIMQRTSSFFYFTTTFFNIVYFVLKQHVLMPIEIFLILFKIFHQLNVKVVPTLPDRYTAPSIGKVFLPQEENVSCFFCCCYCFSYFIRVGFSSVAYLVVAKIVRLTIPLRCQVSFRSWFRSQCWLAGGHTIKPRPEGLLPSTDIKLTRFQIFFSIC